MALVKLTPSETKALVQKMNKELDKINITRHTGMPLTEITGILVGHGMDVDKVRQNVHGDEGRLHVQIAAEIFFTMTWMRMESGRYEIVSYVSSAHDDHRDPYTTVMDATSKRKAKNKLTGLFGSGQQDLLPRQSGGIRRHPRCYCIVRIRLA